VPESDLPGAEPTGPVPAERLAAPVFAAWTTVATPDGPFTIVASDAILASGWTDDVDALLNGVHPRLRPAGLVPLAPDDSDGQPVLGQAVRAVAAYYAGDFQAIDAVPVRQASGPFREAAWQVLRQVPPGHPVSYAEFAALAGRPSAHRAAGAACARNAVALFVPCHRVIRSDGGRGGFGYGLLLKNRLLEREGRTASEG
jgi:methylated-DNA-[protein]-cysteine S-methyltransferase